MPLTIRLTPGYTWTTGDPRIDISRLNLAANPTIELEGTIGTVSIADNSITIAKLVVGILTADTDGRSRMADGYVTAAKLASDSVTTVKILDGNVTPAKASEALRYDIGQYAAGVHTAGVYAVTLSPAATAYTAGMVVRMKADTANAGAVDVNVNGLGAKNIFKNVTGELAAGNIALNQVIEMVYDGTNFQVTSFGSGSFAGVNTALPAATATTAVAHGLGAAPRFVRVVLVCTTNDVATGWLTTDGEFDITAMQSVSNQQMFLVRADATNVNVTRNQNAAFFMLKKSDGNYVQVTAATNFQFKVYAQL